MTSILNYLDSSSSNSNTLGSLSNLKYPTTFIIQPPSSSVNKPTSLLTKRYRPSELGDLLMKKIKTQTSNTSESNSESHSMIEEPRSPSTQSFSEDVEKINGQKSLEGLFPQRSVSTPLLFGGASLRPSKMGIAESHRYVQNALEALEKKILLEQQAASLRDTILKTQLSQEPLYIPPLLSSNSAPSLSKKGKGQEGNNSPQDDDESDFIVGPVEFPLLSMAAPLFTNENGQKASSVNLSGKTIKCPKPLASLYESSKPTEGSFLDSLTVTRAETQRSDSDSSSEDLSQAGEGKKKRGKKASSVKSLEVGGKVKKAHKKEKEQEKKTKSRQQKKDELLSPILSSRRLMERKKNKWQLGGDVQQDQKPKETSEMIIEGNKKKVPTPLGPNYQVELPTLSVRGQSNERRSPKMKWDPLSQDEGELHNFFEALRNLLNFNVDQEKSIKLLKENGNDVKKVLESVEANKDKYIEELAIQSKN
jgi:hypothetical protein